MTEWLSHLDEITGVRELQLFGEKIFPGVGTAKIVFSDKEVRGDRKDCLYVGVGNGKSEFDEHRPDGRLQNECAATLVARRLGILNKPGLKELLTEVLRCDTQPKTFPTQLANLVKAMHRVKKGTDQYGTYLWVCKALDAIVFRERNERIDPRWLWQEFCRVREVPQDEAFEIVNRLVNESFSRRNSLVTELASIVSRMSVKAGWLWLGETFSMLLRDADMFLEAVKEMNSDKLVAFDVQTADGIEPAYFITTNNEHAGRAAVSRLTGKATICVVRNTNGHTQIFSNPDMKLPMGNFIALLRMAEFRKWTGKRLPAKRAYGAGTIPECKQWHLPNPNMILNGSLTHPWIPASILSLEEIQEIARVAFTATGRDLWIKEYCGEKPLEAISSEDSLGILETAMDRANGRK
ncbi:MAG: hypothetical protein ABSF56_01875 [Minisyncoccia bacterium]